MDTKYTLDANQTYDLIHARDTNMRYFNPSLNKRWLYCTSDEYIKKCKDRDEPAWFFDDAMCDIWNELGGNHSEYVVEGMHLDDYEHKYKDLSEKNLKAQVDWGEVFTAIGIRHKDACFYNAIVTSNQEENSLGAETTRWYVSSPFIKRYRAHSEYVSPMRLFERSSIKTNSIAKAAKQIMALPHMTFAHMIPAMFYQQDLEDGIEAVSQADLTEYKDKCEKLFSNLMCLARSKIGVDPLKFIEFTNFIAHLLGSDEREIVNYTAIPEASELASKYLVETKDLAAYVEESSKQTHIYVGQATPDSPVYCFQVGLQRIAPLGIDIPVISTYKKFDSPYQLPELIQSKLATIEINRTNLEEEHNWRYLSNIGARPYREWGKISLQAVFLTSEELQGIFV